MRARIAVLLATTLLATPAIAAPTDVQQCVTASEKGQRARASGKLREARENFLVCGAEICPALIRKDCSQWSSELATALPTVVFGARDKSGKDLFDVTVTMDGDVLATKLDGKAVPVDPGAHTFRFETQGLPQVTEKLLVKEGEKSRVLNVMFDASGGEVQSNGRLQPPVLPERQPQGGGGHTPYPWIIVALGAVGVAIGAGVLIGTPERPSNCAKETQTCVRRPGETEEELRKDQEIAGRADSQPVLGFAIMGIGGAFIVGGLLWHFLEPTNDTRAGLRATPWTTANGGGLSLDARF